MAKINLGLNVGKNKSGLFFFFLVGPRIGPNPLTGPAGPDRGGSGPREKNPLNKRARSEPQVLARGLSPGIEKPDPLPFLRSTSTGIIAVPYISLVRLVSVLYLTSLFLIHLALLCLYLKTFALWS